MGKTYLYSAYSTRLFREEDSAALGRRWRKHRILMSKCHLQGKSPGPNAARGRKHFGSIAGKL